MNHDHNLSSNDIQKFINTLKYSYISIYDGHGLIVMHNMQMLLHSYDKKCVMDLNI
jgi:hypothetical protein